MQDKRSIYKNSLRGFLIVCVSYLIYRSLQPSPSAPVYNRTSPTYTNSKNSDTISIEKILSIAADSINQKAPIWLDSITELSGAIALPNKTLQYNYSLKIDAAKYNIPVLKKSAERTVFTTFIHGSSFALFKKNDVTAVYNYTDMKNNFLFKFIFTPNRYK